MAVLLSRQTRHGWLPEYFCRVGTEPSAVAPGQTQETRPKIDFDPALPRSVLCLPANLRNEHPLGMVVAKCGAVSKFWKGKLS